MKVGDNEVKDILIGDTQVLKVYKGEDVIWERGGLPSGYTRVQYLESVDGQYIDTGYKPSYNSYVKLEYMSTAGQNILHGARNGPYEGLFCFYYSGNTITQQGIQQGKFGRKTTADAQFRINTKYALELSNNGFYVDGTLIESFNQQPFSCDYSYYLFQLNNAGALYIINPKMRVYHCEFKENDTLIHNFIPCLDPNNRPCMFDLVTKQPFYNQGTGEFLYGNII